MSDIDRMETCLTQLMEHVEQVDLHVVIDVPNFVARDMTKQEASDQMSVIIDHTGRREGIDPINVLLVDQAANNQDYHNGK